MENVFPVPDGISFEEAAAIPLTFLTAWRMLVTRARLLRGETLLVVGAGAGVGLAAVAIGRHLGARVLVTSRSPEKRSRALILGVNAALDSGRFSAQVKDATDGRGADVVFEHVGEATIDESLKSLGTGGRLVVCGATSGRTGCIDLPRLFFRQQTVYGSTMGNGTEFADVLEAVGEGMRPQVDRVFELGDIQAALRYLESGSQFGKVVLRVAE
jgi:NADPH:quinone reductase-like Zn-dependent oxidoreductase